MLSRHSWMPRPLLRALVLVCGSVAPVLVDAQERAQSESSRRIKSPAQRLSELEERVKDLEGQVDQLEQEKAAAEAAADSGPFFADGVITVGGVELEFGGRGEFRFIDAENESDPVVGETDQPDPRLELHRLRLVPELRFNRHITSRAQIDFEPERGRVRLKELRARFRVRTDWWFRSTFELGLDDRVIRPGRRTRNYPLVGMAFWKDESVGAVWSFRFGDRMGKPEPDAAAQQDVGILLEAEDVRLGEQNVGELIVEPVDPFDFAGNWGETTLSFSGGQGHVLNNRRIGFDRARFNDIVQDDRSVFDDDLTLSEVGVALEYRRDFDWLGDFRAMGFFYHNTLTDDSVAFLQGDDLTVRDGGGNVLYGYGDSDKREAWRYGFGGEYLLPARTLFGNLVGMRRRDGLRIQGQWIRAIDGEFKRKGWYVQASYRYTFPDRLIAGRYFKSIEPIARYEEFETNLGPFVDLPATWDRERILVGSIFEVTNEVLLRIEYAFNTEDTGGSPSGVDNDEFLVELMLLF